MPELGDTSVCTHCRQDIYYHDTGWIGGGDWYHKSTKHKRCAYGEGYRMTYEEYMSGINDPSIPRATPVPIHADPEFQRVLNEYG